MPPVAVPTSLPLRRFQDREFRPENGGNPSNGRSVGVNETERLICIVEDEPALRHTLGMVLTAAGFTVAAFASAEDFLEFERREAVACLLIDIGLPGIDGFELQERMARDERSLPVILMSGRGPKERVPGRASTGGSVAFLEKPFSQRDLIDAVTRALDA